MKDGSADGLRHQDVMARHLDWDISGERRGAGFEVAEMAIEGGERRASANDAEVDGAATRFARVILRRIHQFAAKAGALARRVDAEQAQVASLAAEFDVDATGETCGIFGDEEFALGHVGAKALGVDTVTFDEGKLDTKSGIDQTD